LRDTVNDEIRKHSQNRMVYY